MFGRDRRLLGIEDLYRELARVSGLLSEKSEKLGLAEEYEHTKKQLVDTEIQLSKVREEHAQKEREIEHKLGLHKIQVEQETAAAVSNATLAVREEALKQKEDRFKDEMAFMQTRFESEVQAQRALVEQMMNRLPVFQHSRVEHIGVDPNPPGKLEITQGG